MACENCENGCINPDLCSCDCQSCAEAGATSCDIPTGDQGPQGLQGPTGPPGGAGGGGSAGGSNHYIQFNNSGSFGGDAELQWDDGADYLYVNGQGEFEDPVYFNDYVALNEVFTQALLDPMIFYTHTGGADYARLQIQTNGDITDGSGGTTFHTGSDIRIKKNITTLASALEIVKSLRGVKFDFDAPESEMDRGTNNRKQYGLIAQEVQKVVPDLVHKFADERKTSKGIIKDVLGVDERLGFVAYLVEAVKELAEKVEKLEEKNV